MCNKVKTDKYLDLDHKKNFRLLSIISDDIYQEKNIWY